MEARPIISPPVDQTPAALDRLFELAASSGTAQNIPAGKAPFVIVPNGFKVETLERLLDKPHPQFIATLAKLTDADSFTKYVNRYKTDNTLIYASVSDAAAKFVAVFDYHGAAPALAPEFCAHRAEYATEHTFDFATWLIADRKAKNQLDFATWLEENQHLFVVPEEWPEDKTKPISGASLLELIETLFGKQDVSFVSGNRLKSGGNSLTYEEQVSLQGVMKSDRVELPDFMCVGLAPFKGSPKYEIRARVKYRIEGRKLSLWLETVRLHKVIEDSINLIVDKVTSDTGIKPLIGTL